MKVGLEACLAIVISALIFTVVKVVRIKYGDMAITHMTSRPYIIAIFIFIISMLELTTDVIATNIVAQNEFAQLVLLLG